MKPRLQRIILTDWPALFCLIGVPGIWICGLVFPFLRRGTRFGEVEIFTIALPVSLVAGIFFLWRVLRIRRLFAHGTRVSGRITGIRLARDRGRIEFMYEFAGEDHSCWTPVHQNKAVLALRVSQQVELFVDPFRPERAIIRHLYT